VNLVKTVMLLSLLTVILYTLSTLLIGGPAGSFTGILLGAITNIGAWYFSDGMVLTSYGAKDPITRQKSRQLYDIVQSLSQKAGLPMPDIYIIPTQAANAFATGRSPKQAAVAVTQGLLRLLPTDELEGVIAHEISHIRNYDTLIQAVAATVANAIAFLAQMSRYGLWFGGRRQNNNGASRFLTMVLSVILLPIAASIIQMAISRTREFEADRDAAFLTGNPLALARALERLQNQGRELPMEGNLVFEPLLIINSFSGQFLGNLFSTHPPTEARIKNLMKIAQELR